MTASITPTSAPAAPDNAARNAAQSGDLKKAAQAFEAIFLRQLLSSARATDFGGEKIFDGPGLTQFQAMFDGKIAEISAQRGAFGIAEAIERQLSAHLAPDQTLAQTLAHTLAQVPAPSATRAEARYG